MTQYRIAVLVGSLRRQSLNRKLAEALFKLAPADFSLALVNTGDLPLYNQDDEGQPAESVLRFKHELGSAQGFLFVTPEYNRSIPGGLKNAIDHGSRPYGQNSWSGKPAGVIGLSPGATGTAMAQQHLRNILSHLDVLAMGQPEAFVQAKDGLFDESGNIAETNRAFFQKWMDRYAAWVRKNVT